MVTKGSLAWRRSTARRQRSSSSWPQRCHLSTLNQQLSLVRAGCPAAPIRSWEEGEDRSWPSQGPMAVHVVPHAGRWRRIVDLEPRSPQGAHPEWHHGSPMMRDSRAVSTASLVTEVSP